MIKKLNIFAQILIMIVAGLKLQAGNVFQAEDASVIYHGIVESEHAGYTGNGYANGDNEVGSYIEWIVNMASSGDQEVNFFYANGTEQDRKMEIIVNGSVVQAELSFPGTGAWTIWTEQSITIFLDSGANTIRATAITSDGGPNIDKIEVTGEVINYYCKLYFDIMGEGSIIIEPNDSIFIKGTEVTLTAIPDSGYVFNRWIGDSVKKENTIILTMDSSISLFAIFLRKGLYFKTYEQVGWSTYESITTGGEGGTIVTVSAQNELENYVNKSEKYIIQVQGIIEIYPMGKEISVGSNTTILGLGNDATLKGGGLGIKNVSNVIVRNLIIKDAYVTWDGKTTDNDAIEINNSQHVWIDHCDLSHFDDGLIDIKNASDFVTVSWCHFHNHNKVILIGAGDDATQDIGHLNTTVHHCWFDGSDGNGIGQRLPMGRFGMIHVYNCYYNDVITRGIEANYDANMAVENNYFLNTVMPHVLVGGAGNNKMNASGNIYINTGTRRDKNGLAFNPADYYAYEMQEAADVPVIVMLGSGVGADSVIGQIDTSGSPIDTNGQVDLINKVMQISLNLEQNFPNPFSAETSINYFVSKLSPITINVYDMTGRRIITLVDEIKKPGTYSIKFDGSKLNPGIYVYQLTSSSKIITKNMILIK